MSSPINRLLPRLPDLSRQSAEQLFDIVPNRADGNCFFYSIAQAILLNRGEFTGVGDNNVKNAANSYREMVCNYYREHLSHPHVAGETEGLERIRFLNDTEDKPRGSNLSQLSIDICKDFEYAEEKEILALVEILQIDIHLMNFGRGGVLTHILYRTNNPQLSVILKYNGIDHYELMLPKGIKTHKFLHAYDEIWEKEREEEFRKQEKKLNSFSLSPGTKDAIAAVAKLTTQATRRTSSRKTPQLSPGAKAAIAAIAEADIEIYKSKVLSPGAKAAILAVAESENVGAVQKKSKTLSPGAIAAIEAVANANRVSHKSTKLSPGAKAAIAAVAAADKQANKSTKLSPGAKAAIAAVAAADKQANKSTKLSPGAKAAIAAVARQLAAIESAKDKSHKGTRKR